MAIPRRKVHNPKCHRLVLGAGVDAALAKATNCGAFARAGCQAGTTRTLAIKKAESLNNQ